MIPQLAKIAQFNNYFISFFDCCAVSSLTLAPIKSIDLCIELEIEIQMIIRGYDRELQMRSSLAFACGDNLLGRIAWKSVGKVVYEFPNTTYPQRRGIINPSRDEDKKYLTMISLSTKPQLPHATCLPHSPRGAAATCNIFF